MLSGEYRAPDRIKTQLCFVMAPATEATEATATYLIELAEENCAASHSSVATLLVGHTNAPLEALNAVVITLFPGGFAVIVTLAAADTASNPMQP